MKAIWKFPICIADSQYVPMQFCAVPVLVGLDPAGKPCIWAKVDPSDPLVRRQVFVTGTGAPLPKDANVHCGSFIQGEFVWHVWIA